MKKTIVLLLIGFVIFVMASKDSMAAKRSRRGSTGISQEEMNTMSSTIDNLTKKVYAASLFSPTENSQLIDIKIKLDNQMLVAPDVALAPLYFKAGNLYKAREYRTEAIECYQTILENFPDTALAPKAVKALKDMGVKVVDPADAKNQTQSQTTGQASPINTETSLNN